MLMKCLIPHHSITVNMYNSVCVCISPGERERKTNSVISKLTDMSLPEKIRDFVVFFLNIYLIFSFSSNMSHFSLTLSYLPLPVAKLEKRQI